MLEKKQTTSQQIASLIEQIAGKKKEHAGRTPILTAQEEKTLQAANYYPCEKYVAQLQALLLKFEPNYSKTPEKTIPCSPVSVSSMCSYPGELNFDDFKKSGSLIKISNHHGSNEMYLYFKEDFIKDFQTLSQIDQAKFIATASKIGFAASENEQGLKHLKFHKKLTRCHAQIHAQHFSTPFSHEIKINGTTDRIAVYTLSPNEKGTGPTILIATHVLKGGIHNNQHQGKSLQSNDLYDYVTLQTKSFTSSKVSMHTLPEKSSSEKLPEKTAEQLGVFGLFKAGPDVAVKTNDFISEGPAKLVIKG